MADTTNKRQVNALLPLADVELLETLKTGKEQELGFSLSLGDFLASLLRLEAKRQGVKLKARK
jgi:hypothetical protein